MNCVPKDGAAMTHEEIARRLGVSTRTVMRAEQRALWKLRMSLERITREGEHPMLLAKMCEALSEPKQEAA